MKSYKGYLFILGATMFWGISATIAKFLFNRQVETLILVQMRITISFILLFLFFIFLRRDLLKIKLRDLYKFALLGILGVAGSNFTYYFTIAVTNVATAILLQYLAPIFVLIYGALSRDEKITMVKIISAVVSLVGCYMAVAGKNFSIIEINQIGILTGLGSAFCWSFTNVWLKRLLKTYNVWTCLIYSFMLASIFWLTINPPWKIISIAEITSTAPKI
jgi:drug/metabolite transporter (DMT)-like permease